MARLRIIDCLIPCLIATFALTAFANDTIQPSGIYQGTKPVVQFDESRPLRDMTPKPIPRSENRGGLIIDPPGNASNKLEAGPQTPDAAAQTIIGFGSIPDPLISFDGPNNISGVSPPDPIGDVGPNHYVVMSNLFFQIYDKTGVSLLGPLANNTLWDGFGGACENENAGDPVVLHDQIADRWFLSQFTSAGPQFFFCVAVSTSPDPTGTYFRYAISTGTNFPDYPKAGIWSDGYYISTREFAGAFAGIGAYAMDRDAVVAGDPNATILSFLVTPGGVGAENTGDGLLPADLDGFDMPPAGSPAYFVGSMDDGGPYGAPQDALTFWRFDADFDNPPASSFTLTDTIPIAAFDTIFPCPGGGRSCIPQPGTGNLIDILSYRQRPIHRLAYRNFGSHESLVTSQSVEGPNQVAGTRWWEIRLPGGNPVIHQEGTYSPGATDGIHRWMGSAAMDSAGNIALGYSASDATSVFPSLRYSGRLSSDPLGTFPQGEGSIVEGTGAQTGSQRWGDYSSLNIDPTDDCTFWYTNEYYITDSGNGWQLRIGAFRFNECGTPGFTMGVQDATQSICAGDPAVYDLTFGSIADFDQPVTLAAQNLMAPATAAYSPNPVPSLPGTSQLTISNTAGLGDANFIFQTLGTASGADDRSIDLNLASFAAVPDAPILNNPANGQANLEFRPAFVWSGSNTENYTLELATDMAFNNIVFSTTVNTTTAAVDSDLASNTRYFWRVRATNACGDSVDSATFTFITMPAPGDCPAGITPIQIFSDDIENGDNGWTHSGTQDTWQRSGLETSSGNFAWFAEDLPSVSDQQLVSPAITLPNDQLPMVLSFQNSQTIEDDAGNGACWDAAILEISIDDGSNWTQIMPSELLTDPYDGTVNDFMAGPNPLVGLQAWCADPEDFIRSIVDLSAYQGETVRFRFRMGTDSSVGRAGDGWFVDDVMVQACPASEDLLVDGFEDLL